VNFRLTNENAADKILSAGWLLAVWENPYENQKII